MEREESERRGGCWCLRPTTTTSTTPHIHPPLHSPLPATICSSITVAPPLSPSPPSSITPPIQFSPHSFFSPPRSSASLLFCPPPRTLTRSHSLPHTLHLMEEEKSELLISLQILQGGRRTSVCLSEKWKKKIVIIFGDSMVESSSHSAVIRNSHKCSRKKHWQGMLFESQNIFGKLQMHFVKLMVLVPC